MANHPRNVSPKGGPRSAAAAKGRAQGPKPVVGTAGALDSTQRGHARSEARRLRDRMGVTQRALSNMLSVSNRALANWEAGQDPGPAAKRAMTELDRLHRALCRIMQPGFVAAWLQSANDRFDGLAPIKLIEAGQTDRIWRMIWQQESGVAS